MQGSAALALAGAAAAQAGDQTPVRLAAIGVGARGCDLIQSLTTIEGVDLAAVCDPYEPHLAQGVRYAGPRAKAFRDYRRMLDEIKPQAVIIAVPLNLHFQVAGDCLSAGCDAYCEKMMCYDVGQARRLAEQVRARGAVFQVGLQRRANAIYRQAAAMVGTGLLGQITAVKCQWHRHNNWRRPVPLPRDHAGFPALERQLNWRLYRATSQGLMAELGSHQIDVVGWLLDAAPQRVLAAGGIDYWRDGREVYDNVFCVYEFERPSLERGEPYTVRATYSSLQNNAYEGASETVFGTRGTLFLTQHKGLLFREAAAERIDWSTRADKNASLLAAGKTLKLNNDPWAHRGKPIEIDAEGDDTRAALVSFVDHVRRRDPATICDAATGLLNTAAVLIANQAIESASRVEFPGDLARAAAG